MKLALSGRLWETSQGSASTLLQQIQIAAELGYQGIEVRYPLIPQAGEWDAVKETLARHNIELVFAPGAGVPSTPGAFDDLSSRSGFSAALRRAIFETHSNEGSRYRRDAAGRRLGSRTRHPRPLA